MNGTIDTAMSGEVEQVKQRLEELRRSFDVSAICHKMEDLLGGVRDGGNNQVSVPLIDALPAATDAVRNMVAAEVEERDCEVVPADVIGLLTNVEFSKEAVASAPPEEAAAVEPISEDDPDGVGPEPESECRTVPEHDSAAPGSREPGRQPEPASAPSTMRASGSTTDTVRLRVDMLETLGNRTGELVVAGDRLRQRLGVVRELPALIHREHKQHARGSAGAGAASRPRDSLDPQRPVPRDRITPGAQAGREEPGGHG